MTEYIKKDEMISVMIQRYDMLREIADNLRSELETAPEGSLNVAQRKGKAQYYHFLPNVQTEGKYRGTYIRKADFHLACQLAQKDYNAALLFCIEDEIHALSDCLRRLSDESGDELTDLYSRIIPARKEIVTPVILPDDRFVNQWKSVTYEGKGFLQSDPEHYTDMGERVRSKSEVMIANALARAGVPYRYEYPVNLKGYGIVYPDFQCLNVRTRSEIVWEHLGLLDDEEYREAALNKINRYEANGYYVGKRLIISHETGGYPLNIKIIESKIKAFLL